MDDQIDAALQRLHKHLTPKQFLTLSFIIESFLDGRLENLAAKTIANTLVDEGPSDESSPQDPTGSIRQLVLGIRRRLLLYYEGEGRLDPVRIGIPPERDTKLFIPTIERRPYFEPFNKEATERLQTASSALDERTLAGYALALNDLDTVPPRYRDHPRVLALKARVHLLRAMYGCPPRREMEEAKRLVKESLAQTEDLWEAHAADACVKALVDRQWEAAEGAWKRALALPGGEEVRKDTFYLSYLVSQGQTEEVLRLITKKYDDGGYRVAMDRTDVAAFYFLAGDRQHAERILRDNIKLHPNYYLSYLHLALVLENDDPEQALAVIGRIRLKPWEVGVTWGIKAFLYGRCGRKGRAMLILKWFTLINSLNKRLPGSLAINIPASQIGMAALGAGRLEEAVEWFRQAADDLDPLVDWLGIAPWLRELHPLKSFQSLVSEMGLTLPTPPTEGSLS